MKLKKKYIFMGIGMLFMVALTFFLTSSLKFE